MKKVILLIGVILASLTSLCAQGFDPSMMGFKPVIISEKAPESVAAYLESRVNDILTNEGIAHSKGDCVMEVVINEISRVMTPTAPPRTQIKLEITFNAIDKSQGVVFNSITLPATGMNASEAAAYMAAVQSINFRTRNFLNFIESSKKKLYDYYAAGYAVHDEPAPVPAPVPAPAPAAEEPAPAPAPQAPRGVEISKGVFVEYCGHEDKSSSTHLLLKFTNYNDSDEVVDLNWRTQLVVDSKGKNIEERNNFRYNDNNIVPGQSLKLIKGVPVDTRLTFKGTFAPEVLFFSEASRDIKVRIECK